MQKYILPAGKYYIGDPCYVIRGANWQKVCDELEDGIYTNLNHPFFMASTAYGDGSYMDQEGNEYGVDSGQLGAVPIALIETSVAQAESLGIIRDFPDGLIIGYGTGATFEFGEIVIHTDEVEDDEM